VDERPPPLPASMSASRRIPGHEVSVRGQLPAEAYGRCRTSGAWPTVAEAPAGGVAGASQRVTILHQLNARNGGPSVTPRGQSRRPFAADRRTGGVHIRPLAPPCRLSVTTRGIWATPSPRGVLATSLYDDPAAELHDDASARLREHPALLGCSILRRSSPGSGVSGYQDPAGGHDEGAVANHRERPVSRDTALRVSCRIRIRFLGFRAGTGESSVSPEPARTIRWIGRHFGDPAAACWRHQDPGARPEGCWRTVIRRAREGSAVSDEPEDHFGTGHRMP
jgi:hypothetical protein